MIKEYFFATDGGRVYDLYQRTVGSIWPLDKEIFYDVLVFKPPAESVKSFFSSSQGIVNGFVSTQIMGKRGSIVLLIFKPGGEYIGEKLVRKVLGYFKEHNVEEIQLAAGGYTSVWPGIPTNLPHLVSFFDKQGLEFIDNSVDMIRDIKKYTTPDVAIGRAQSAGVTLSFLNPNEGEELLAFEHKNFPLWERYFQETLEKKQFDDVLIAKSKTGGIVGSALVSRDDEVIWTELLGSSVGTIGALGVAEKMRRKGIGLSLVARATEILRDRHLEKSYLRSVGWYGELGYHVWRDYKVSWKKLEL